jgi:phage terminase large subunit-like protein
LLTVQLTVSDLAVAQDPAGNLKPAKDKSTERIDGIVATIMAIGRAMVAQEQFVDTPMVIWV